MSSKGSCVYRADHGEPDGGPGEAPIQLQGETVAIQNIAVSLLILHYMLCS